MLTGMQNFYIHIFAHNCVSTIVTLDLVYIGMFPPTSGTAIINGYDITKDMKIIRDNLGLCPQHNMLFNKLTVKEHFVFFGKVNKLTF